MTITMTKKTLLEKLAERLKAAKVEDARLTKLHHAEEADALKKFRERLREALKWDYGTVKAQSRNYGGGLAMDRPACPRRNAMLIEDVIRLVTMTSSARFSVRPGTDIYRAVTWLPEVKRVGATVCD